jgi:hypothetical protein
MNTIFAYNNTPDTQSAKAKKAWDNIIHYIVYIVNHKKIPILAWLLLCIGWGLWLYIYFITMTSTTGYFLAQASKKYDAELFAYNVDKLYIIDLQSRIREDISRRVTTNNKTITL